MIKIEASIDGILLELRIRRTGNLSLDCGKPIGVFQTEFINEEVGARIDKRVPRVVRIVITGVRWMARLGSRQLTRAGNVLGDELINC